MFDLPCPKRFLRLSTAMLAMVTYRCMLPPKTGGREKDNTNTTLSGLRVVRFICFVFCFVLFYVLCFVQPWYYTITIVISNTTYKLAWPRKEFFGQHLSRDY